MSYLPPDLTLLALALALGITLAAGIVKGAVGFAMPLIMISGISSIMDPKLALAGIIVPIVVSNLWQTLRAGLGPAWEAVVEFRRYLIIVSLAIFAAAQGVALIPDQVFYAVLGIPVVVLCLIQLIGVRLSIPPHRRNIAEWIIGLISGLLGGFAGTWGPTTVLFLLAIDTPKKKQMVVQGVIYGLGSVVLLLAHLRSGILNAGTAPLSILLVLPAFIGMWIGFQIQDRLNATAFRKVTLIVLTIAGLNLVRKAFM
jgi:uncharacterized membrane protein YfcA